MIVNYEEWLDKNGDKIRVKLEDWLADTPDCVDLTQIGIYGNGEDFIQSCLDSEYESFISDYEDRMYEEYKDGI